jgi:hypothetical protein
MIFLLGVGGLAVDIGRMYITKAETQSFVDSAAFYAVVQLDGTPSGVTRAQAAVTSDPKKWGFGNNSFAGVQTAFGTTPNGPFTTTPPNPPLGYYFVQVAAQVNLPMYLIRPLAGPMSSIAARAVAGRAATTSLPGGEFPFSPYTRAASPDNASDPFGYQIANQYTFRWGAPGTRTDCGTDATQPNLSQNGRVRGYCCTSQSAADLRGAIVSGNTDPVSIGSPVPMVNGAKQTEMSAIAMRVALDSDMNSTTYAQYRALGQGNGTRVVQVPVNGGAPDYINVGFAGFFLLNYDYYNNLKGGNNSACAEYIGNFIQGVPTPIPSGSGAFHMKLYQ